MNLAREPKKVIDYNYIIKTNYYETSSGGILHYHKEHIDYIKSGPIQNFLDYKKDIKTTDL